LSMVNGYWYMACGLWYMVNGYGQSIHHSP
jgi:hypothetical protein